VVVCKQINRFSSSVQSRLVRRAIKHHSVHYPWWTLSGTNITRQSGQPGRLQKAAYAELQRPRVGRLARITGTVEEMLPPEVID
jgi:hypothetical protein